MPATRAGGQRRQSPRFRRDEQEEEEEEEEARQDGLLFATVTTTKTNDPAGAAGAVPKVSRMITPPQPTGKKKNKGVIKRTRPKEEYSEEEEEEEEEEEIDDDGRTGATATTSHVFAGVQYDNYQDMVRAKRERNQRVLQESGLLQAVVATSRQKSFLSRQKGLPHAAAADNNKRKGTTASVLLLSAGAAGSGGSERRVSKRIRGEIADGRYIADERGGRVTVVMGRNDQQGGGGVTAGDDDDVINTDQQHPQQAALGATDNYYRGRVNNGEPLSIERAIQECDAKWIEENATSQATMLLQQMEGWQNISSSAPRGLTTNNNNNNDNGYPRTSIITRDHPSHEIRSLQAMIQALTVNDDVGVAKVCPDRIYSVAVHPCTESTIVCAGDKTGYVGLWKQDTTNHDDNDDNDIHCLFRPHHGAVTCLEWHANGRRLWSTSYDGTVRSLDVETRQFDQVFATYDDNNDDERYKSQLGFGLETSDKFWIQFACLDPHQEQCLYVSTSLGAALHVDLRSPQQITFHRVLSEKKINTLSMHPNGYALVSAGLDCTVAIWDVRNLGSSTKNGRTTTKRPLLRPMASYNCGRSINSAFLSSTGASLVCTTMANTLEVFSSVAEVTNDDSFRPAQVIHHDNKTGRWLTTFQAVYHPNIEHLFAVGSMAKPRRLDVFDDRDTTVANHGVSGEALTAVVSRLTFHPRTDRIIVAGGNSSGRVTIFR